VNPITFTPVSSSRRTHSKRTSTRSLTFDPARPLQSRRRWGVRHPAQWVSPPNGRGASLFPPLCARAALQRSASPCRRQHHKTRRHSASDREAARRRPLCDPCRQHDLAHPHWRSCSLPRRLAIKCKQNHPGNLATSTEHYSALSWHSRPAQRTPNPGCLSFGGKIIQPSSSPTAVKSPAALRSATGNRPGRNRSIKITNSQECERDLKNSDLAPVV
jgi:hypothetical protein